jgi:uncharacterized membrane protein
VLTWLTIPVTTFVLAPEDADAWTIAAIPFWLLALATTYRYYRFRSPDLAALTLGAAALSTVALTGLGRLVSELVDSDAFLLILAFLVLGVVSLAVIWLRRVHRAMAEERHHAS